MGDRPNLLFLWTDQQAIDTMSAYGNDRIETPNLDRLAESGAVFENAYCTSPVCGPSRSAIMTGKWPHQTRSEINNVPLDPAEDCLFELLEGYTTGYMGKWHLGDEVFHQRGFEEWVSIEDYYIEYFTEGRPRDARSDYHEFLTEAGFDPDLDTEAGDGRFSREFAAGLPEEYSKPAFLADHATRFIREHRDEPFALSVMFLEPHSPYTGPRDDQYDPDDVPLPPNFEHDGLAAQPDAIRERRESWLEQGLPPDRNPPPTDEKWRKLIANYWGLVSLVDTHVGRILDTLEKCGLADNTLVVFTSDHGDQMGSHKLWAKGVMFEESTRIPLLMRFPDGAHSGVRVEQRTSQIDLLPTVLDAMDQPRPPGLSGESRLSLLEGEPDRDPGDIFIEYHEVPEGMDSRGRLSLQGASDEEVRDRIDVYTRCLVTQDGWKYVYRSRSRDSLYDLDRDPYETRDLIDEESHEATVADLQERLSDRQQRLDDPFPGP